MGWDEELERIIHQYFDKWDPIPCSYRWGNLFRLKSKIFGHKIYTSNKEEIFFIQVAWRFRKFLFFINYTRSKISLSSDGMWAI